MKEHRKDIEDKKYKHAMSDHQLSHTGHKFDLASAEVIWESNNKYECQLMETACISTFPNCNNNSGDIVVSPAYTSASIHVSGLRKLKRTNIMRQNPPHVSTGLLP